MIRGACGAPVGRCWVSISSATWAPSLSCSLRQGCLYVNHLEPPFAIQAFVSVTDRLANPFRRTEAAMCDLWHGVASASFRSSHISPFNHCETIRTPAPAPLQPRSIFCTKDSQIRIHLDSRVQRNARERQSWLHSAGRVHPIVVL